MGEECREKIINVLPPVPVGLKGYGQCTSSQDFLMWLADKRDDPNELDFDARDSGDVLGITSSRSERFCTALPKQVGESIGGLPKAEVDHSPGLNLDPIKGKT